jgi:hypothetical protein
VIQIVARPPWPSCWLAACPPTAVPRLGAAPGTRGPVTVVPR